VKRPRPALPGIGEGAYQRINKSASHREVNFKEQPD
jgi:hypothetical protein